MPRQLLTTSLEDVLRDPGIQVVAELVGGVDWARRAVLALLEAGKDVVTANKALLALHGAEVFEAARRHGRAVAFEASVAGGIPIIAALTQGLAANQILALQGILNGTCNFILTNMTEEDFKLRRGGAAEAAAARLRRGRPHPWTSTAPTPPTSSAILGANQADGVAVPPEKISRRGIDAFDAADIRFAGELGYVIKLLAETFHSRDGLALHVSPVLLRETTPLARVRGAYNAIHVVGDGRRRHLLLRPGAGRMPTASAVTADLT